MILFVAVTENKDGGYRVQLRSRLAATVPDMQSRRLASLSEAKREARRLFGELRWQEPKSTGVHQDYVRAIAEITAEGRDV